MKITIGISIVGLTLLASHVALGVEREGSTVWDGFSGFVSPDWNEDFSATIGVKVWLNEWTRDDFLNTPISGDIPVDGGIIPITARTRDRRPDAIISEDIEATPIPQLGIRYKWMVLTGSYYTKTDFDFETTERIGEIVANGFPVSTLDVTEEDSGERYEWDVAGGIYVHPYVAILGGYKKVRQKISLLRTVNTSNFLTNETTTESVSDGFEFAVRGPTIGVAASVPIGKGFGVYTSYAHGFMDIEVKDEQIPGKRDGDYNVAELGFSYTHGTKHLAPHMPLSAATAYVGYRYQIIETDLDKPAQDRTDITKGFAAGVNLSF